MFRALRATAAIVAAAILPATPASAGIVQFDASIAAIAARPVLAHAIVGVEFYDLDAHRVLYARNPQTLMEAASTTKLVTAGTALSLLGPDFRWKTPVYRTGPVDGSGSLHGDLVLVASGDPNLSQRLRPGGTLAFENEDHSYDGSPDTRAVPGDPLAILRELAAAVRRAGIVAVDGRVLVDDSLFSDRGPEAGTGAVLSPIVVNDNLVDVTVTPGSHPGDPAAIAISPETSYVAFVNRIRTGPAGSEPSVDFSDDRTNADGTHTVTIVGKQPAGSPVLYAYRVPEPDRFARRAFAAALAAAGVAVTPEAAAGAFVRPSAPYAPSSLVAEHVSPTLAQDVYVTLKVSDNLHAALLPYMWAIYGGRAAKGDVKTAAFAAERALLARAGLHLAGAAQQDGLGGSAFFAPDFMVRYLAWAKTQAWFPALQRGLPILGTDGTLFNIQNGSPAKGKVTAKTGTWGSDNRLDADQLVSKGLAGYVTTRSGRHVAFAVYINRMAGKGSAYPSKDAGHQAGEILGEMASDAYLLL